MVVQTFSLHCNQSSLLVELGETYGVLEMQHRSAACRASDLITMVSVHLSIYLL